MKFFIIEVTYTAPLTAIEEALPRHRAFLQTGYDAGNLLVSGPQNPRTGGVIVGKFTSLDEAHAFFAQDPYQQEQLASYRYIEFNPVKRASFLDDWIIA